MPPGQPQTKTWLAVGLVATIAWVMFLVSQGPRRGGGSGDAPDLEGTGLTMPADFAWTLHDLDGSPVEFAKFRGKPILLNIWATWCPPCLEEMPSLARLADDPRIKKSGVAVVCASVDESPEALKRFMKGKDWGMTVLRATATPRVFETEGIPATFLIAPDGTVVATHGGSARWDDPSVVEFLEKLAAKP